ncbi:MAG: family 16 glycosylhydrolase [Flavobacteriaceae bacterium]
MFFSCNSEAEESSLGQSVTNINAQTPSSASNNNSTSTISELVSPNLNDVSITFEEVTISFLEEDIQPSDRTSGNWGRFGGIGSINLSVLYSDNPESNDLNDSSKVIKVIEPSGIQSWAGFYFVLEENLNFPEGKEAISFQFYSPGPGHIVLLKLEDQLPNDSIGKKTTGDLFAETTGVGWETLVFNIPELDGRNGIYNTITMILGHDLSNQTEVNYYLDNFNFSPPLTITADPVNIDSSEESTIYSGYQLVWNDEFNYEGAPSDEKWHLQYIPIIDGGWANDEKQHYTTRRDNSFVSDGTLKIVAKKELYAYEAVNRAYTSARLNSKFDIRYGRIDVRAKLPVSKGTWPAIWTLGTNIGEVGNYYGTSDGNVGWPECGEIDIMEQNGTNKQLLYGTFHWSDSGGQQDSFGLIKDISSLNVSNLSTEFHLYSLIWTSASLKIYVDNFLVSSIENTASVPFDNPHYLLLNVAMGGTLGGVVPGTFEEDKMEIDYVRFYQ